MPEQIINNQVVLPWGKAFRLAAKSLKKRFVRSVITMISVILAIAFLMSIWAGNNVVEGLKVASKTGQYPELTSLLTKNGVVIAKSGISSKMLWLIVLSLVTCSVGIVNAMLMSVTERFKEIGTMKCLGAMDGFIIKLFIIEAMVQGAIGTFVGIVVGLLIGILGNLITYGRHWEVLLHNLPVGAIAFSAAVSFIIGVALCTFFAIYPAYVASQMQPVDAMRVEE